MVKFHTPGWAIHIQENNYKYKVSLKGLRVPSLSPGILHLGRGVSRVFDFEDL